MGLVVGTDPGKGPSPPDFKEKKKNLNLAPLQFYIDKIVRALALAVVK